MTIAVRRDISAREEFAKRSRRGRSWIGRPRTTKGGEQDQGEKWRQHEKKGYMVQKSGTSGIYCLRTIYHFENLRILLLPIKLLLV